MEYQFTIAPLQPASDILMAQLGEAGFESFVEAKDGVLAYILESEWHEGILNDIGILNWEEATIDYRVKRLEKQNWNAVWERNFTPIEVDGQCRVRAPFHEKIPMEYDIVIEPKMSFGTGHHETTHMMIQHILETDFSGKKVLDMGCGTGVLAILSSMKGATHIDAIDIDRWSFENASENVEKNRCSQISVYEGDVQLIRGKKYYVILANINRNILLDDIPSYADCLIKGGILILSGFYTQDLKVINKKCASEGLKFEKKVEKNNWVAAKYVF